MGEVNGDFDGRLNLVGEDVDEERVQEWEVGLPNFDDIAPLTMGLVPPELLSAFNIKPEPHRTSGEVRQASEDTLSLLRGTNFKGYSEENDGESETKKQRRTDSPEDADSAAAAEVAADATAEAEAGGGCGGGAGGGGGGGGEKAVKRSRLVWTPQLHKRFVDVVGHLGIKNAVPKTIMQLMNVEGLTRENVASHLQKYRLYLKRMQGGSFDAGTNSSSENGNGNGNASGNAGMSGSVPVMPMMGMDMGAVMRMGNYNGFDGHHTHNHHNFSNHNSNNKYYNHHHQYSNGNGMMKHSGNKYGSIVSYHPPHVGSGDN